MFGVYDNLICVSCNNDVASIFRQNIGKLLHKDIENCCKYCFSYCTTLCSMLEVIAKFNDVGICLYVCVVLSVSVVVISKGCSIRSV